MKLALSCFTLLVFAGLAGAQEVPRFTGSIAGGLTNPVGNTGQRLDTG